MNIDVSQVWKGVVVMLAVLVVFVVSAQAFALGSGPDAYRQVDATFEVDPTAEDQVDAPFEVDPTAENQVDATLEVDPTAELDGRHLQGGAHHLLDAAFEGVFNVELDGRHLQGGAHHLMDMGADLGLLGASGHTETNPPGTVEAATSKAVTLSARVRESSGVTGTVDFTFEIETPPDALDLPAGDDLVSFPAVFPAQTVTFGEETSSIPEPTVLVLVGLGVIGLALLRRIWGRGTHP